MLFSIDDRATGVDSLIDEEHCDARRLPRED